MSPRFSRIAKLVTAFLALALLGQGTASGRTSALMFGDVEEGCRLGVEVRGAPAYAGHRIDIRVVAELAAERAAEGARPALDLPGFMALERGARGVSYQLLDARGQDVPMTLYARRVMSGRSPIDEHATANSPVRRQQQWHVRLDALFDTSLPGPYRLRVTQVKGNGEGHVSFTATSGFFEIRETP